LLQEENIAPIFFPPHATHELQPLDRTIFGVFKHWARKDISAWVTYLTKTGSSIRTCDYPFVINRAFAKAHTDALIRQSFSETGLCPFLPQLVLDRIAADVERAIDFAQFTPADDSDDKDAPPQRRRPLAKVTRTEQWDLVASDPDGYESSTHRRAYMKLLMMTMTMTMTMTMMMMMKHNTNLSSSSPPHHHPPLPLHHHSRPLLRHHTQVRNVFAPIHARASSICRTTTSRSRRSVRTTRSLRSTWAFAMWHGLPTRDSFPLQF
jgi:hypothetical protein